MSISMDSSSSTFKTTKTNRWETLSSPSEKGEKKNRPIIIPPLTRPACTPIAFDKDLFLPNDSSPGINDTGISFVRKGLSTEKAKTTILTTESIAINRETYDLEYPMARNDATLAEKLAVKFMESQSTAQQSRSIETDEPTKSCKEIVSDMSELGEQLSSSTKTSTAIEKLPPLQISKKLIFLIARQCFDRSAMRNQRNAKTILDVKGIQYETIDGTDPVNEEVRNVLFSLSGKRGTYPQFFLVYGSNKVFWGDFQKFTEANDDGILEQELGGWGKSPPKKSKYDDTPLTVGTTPIASSLKESVCAATKKTESSLHALFSKQSFDRVVRQNQQDAFTILDSKGFKYQTVHGTNYTNKKERDALFAFSRLHAECPQVFLPRDVQMMSFGSTETLIKANETGSLANDLGLEPAEPVVFELVYEATANSRAIMHDKQGHADESVRNHEKELDLAPTNTAQEMAETLKTENATGIAPIKRGEKSQESALGNTSRFFGTPASVVADNRKAPTTDITIFDATNFAAKHVITYMVSSCTMTLLFHCCCYQIGVSHLREGANKYTSR